MTCSQSIPRLWEQSTLNQLSDKRNPGKCYSSKNISYRNYPIHFPSRLDYYSLVYYFSVYWMLDRSYMRNRIRLSAIS